MNAAERRGHILDYLRAAEGPLSATALAQKLSVSRQIIVGDVALLRAAGEAVTATPRGYVLDRPRTGLRRTVEHPVCGQLTGPLDLSSRYDVSEFIRRVEENAARPLSLLTDGIHLHTLRCPDEGAFRRAVGALEDAGFLVT